MSSAQQMNNSSETSSSHRSERKLTSRLWPETGSPELEHSVVVDNNNSNNARTPPIPPNRSPASSTAKLERVPNSSSGACLEYPQIGLPYGVGYGATSFHAFSREHHLHPTLLSNHDNHAHAYTSRSPTSVDVNTYGNLQPPPQGVEIGGASQSRMIGQSIPQFAPYLELRPPSLSSESGSTPGDSGPTGDQEDPAVIEDKRRRNTMASARFRVKKKQKVLNLERTVSELSSRAEDLEREAMNLRRENTWLKEIVIMKGRHNLAVASSSSPAPNHEETGGAATQSEAGAKDQSSTSEDSSTDHESEKRKKKKKKKNEGKGKGRASKACEKRKK